MRQTVNSGSPLEAQIAFSRAARIGDSIAIAGTAPIGAEEAYGQDDAVYRQTRRCLEIVAEALSNLGCTQADVVRTRVILTDISQWEQAARAHGEMFAAPGPACTFMEVSRFIDPRWLVEIETDAVVTNR